MATSLVREPDERVNWLTSLPFFAIHLLCFAAIFTGISRAAVALFLVLFWGRMFLVTAGYHRYFAHRSFKLNRFWQFVLAFGAVSSSQKGVLWWAAHHRDHHRFSDTSRDIHSPRKGFWWSHVGWILCDRYGPTKLDGIKDFARYPELRWLDRYNWIAPWSLAIGAFLIAGWSGLVVGFLWSTVLLWHSTFMVNSVAHVFGRRRYDTDDTSRNTLLVALIAGGEGWHNNHHQYAASARQGFFWWEIDTTYYGLKVLSWLGIVRDLRTPPARILRPETEPELQDETEFQAA